MAEYKFSVPPKTVPLTEGLLSEFLAVEPFKRDRKLSPARMKLIRIQLLAGRMRTTVWATVYCEETGKFYRMNGQHTSTEYKACIDNRSLTDPGSVYITLERFQCKTLQDVASLYSTFDTRSSARSQGDINGAFAATEPRLEKISLKVLNTIVAGASYALLGRGADKEDAHDRAARVIDEADFVLWCWKLFQPDNPPDEYGGFRHLQRAPSIAVMFKTWKRHPAAAEAFWTAVRDATGRSPTQGCRQLHRWLDTHSITGSSRTSVGKPSAGRREFHVRCIHGWNAWATGKATKLSYFPEAGIPSIKVPTNDCSGGRLFAE